MSAILCAALSSSCSSKSSMRLESICTICKFCWSASVSASMSLFRSAPRGNGCVGASILPREAVGTQAQHAAQNRISLALANRYPAGSPLWHLFNNFYRHTVHKADCAENLHEEVMHD